MECSRGMGFMNVKHLYFRNAKVYLGSRDEAKGKAAVAQLKHMRDKAMFEVCSIHSFSFGH